MKPESSVIFFPCKNMEETKKYYTTVLGLPVYKDLGSSVWFDCGYGYLAFCDYGPDRPWPQASAFPLICRPWRMWTACMKP